mmetsp:Transcript_35456/g.34491  ORF Transcript_35456/g.34491 Transcript_35456/m.34491 type:complete len:239 (-) Transcript_35456:519-1235(-)
MAVVPLRPFQHIARRLVVGESGPVVLEGDAASVDGAHLILLVLGVGPLEPEHVPLRRHGSGLARKVGDRRLHDVYVHTVVCWVVLGGQIYLLSLSNWVVDVDAVLRVGLGAVLRLVAPLEGLLVPSGVVRRLVLIGHLHYLEVKVVDIVYLLDLGEGFFDVVLGALVLGGSDGLDGLLRVPWGLFFEPALVLQLRGRASFLQPISSRIHRESISDSVLLLLVLRVGLGEGRLSGRGVG